MLLLSYIYIYIVDSYILLFTLVLGNVLSLSAVPVYFISFTVGGGREKCLSDSFVSLVYLKK